MQVHDAGAMQNRSRAAVRADPRRTMWVGRGSDLPDPRRHHRHAVAARRRHRHHGAAGCGRTAERCRSAVRGGEPGGRQRQHRDPRRRPRGAGGYTLLLTISGFQTTNPALFKSLKWDPVRDFSAVAMVSRSPQLLVVNKNSPANTLADLIAYARANPGKLTYGSPGVGTQNNIASLQLAQDAHIKVTTVPYRATAAAFNDLLGGTLGFFVNTTQQLVGPLQGRVVKGLVIFSPKRHPLLPDVPTAAEAGFPDLQIDTWYALYAPAGTPKAVVDRLAGEIKTVVGRREFKARVEKSGATIDYMGPEQLTAYTRQEVAHWRDVVRNLGIPAQSQ